MSSFSKLALPAEFLDNLTSLGYESMTPIQAESLPLILDGKDVIAKAKTGSGKTAAFGIGLLNALNVKQFAIQSIVLCPTRELADQVAKELRRIARYLHNVKILTLCGGVAIGPQLGSLEHGAHIIVGTPGRILDHLRKGSLQLNHVKQLVLDEADRMLDMGFADDVEEICRHCPESRQTLLFSATYPPKIEKISQGYQKNPVMVEVESIHADQKIEQHFYKVADTLEKFPAVISLLMKQKPKTCIIFCNTKQDCDDLCEALQRKDIQALALHGDMEQRERDQMLVRFANKTCPVLIATDVAARGIDVKQLDLVINFELARDSDVHIHRIGRTGRAGEDGVAFSLVSEKELVRVERIEELMQASFTLEDVPDLTERPYLEADWVTLNIDGGKKDKLRAGDIIGALTKDAGLEFGLIGKIDIFNFYSFVAVHQSIYRKALQQLQDGKLKGRKFRARKLG